ncbi:small ribosomal subunit protein eS8y-like [Cicer arietinum]|uniref:small ribosomal subunit protein eS8y-like n=1 Tax=Cicer arietinum TaxID=3827 RepID=UPI003CC6740E
MTVKNSSYQGLNTFQSDNQRYELGRQLASTKLSSNKTIRRIRVRGGNVKWRDLRWDTGNFSWGSEAVTRKTRLLDMVYNASNNELVRTQTLVKNAIVQVDVAPFKQWYLQHYGVEIGRNITMVLKLEVEVAAEEAKKNNHVQRKLENRQKDRQLDSHIEEQFGGGRLLACILSHPGQCGRLDGYILEGKEPKFYMKKLQRKREMVLLNLQQYLVSFKLMSFTLDETMFIRSTYKAILASPKGVNIFVELDVLSFTSLEEKQTCVLTLDGATKEFIGSGSLIWDDGRHQLKSPIIIFDERAEKISDSPNQ